MTTSVQSPLTATRISRPADLDLLQPEWNALWSSAPRTTPFQSPAWLIPWWHHIGVGQLSAIQFRAQAGGLAGQLVGFVPLYVSREAAMGLRQLFPVGIGTSDYLDGLFAPGWEQACVGTLFDVLNDHCLEWDAFELPQLPPGSVLLASAPPGWLDHVEPSEPCPVLVLPEDAASWDACLPTGFRRRLAYERKRAARLAELQFVAADGRTLDELTHWLFVLHARCWQARGQRGVLTDASVERMHREALPGLLKAGGLRMWGLRVDGRMTGVFYGLADHENVARRCTYYYLGGFDPQFSRIGPGKLLIAYAIERAVSEGAREFDFLRGQEAYKYMWGAQDRPTWCRRLARGPMLQGISSGDANESQTSMESTSS